MTASPNAERYSSLVPFDRSTLESQPVEQPAAKSGRLGSWRLLCMLLIGAMFGIVLARLVGSFGEDPIEETVAESLPRFWKLLFLITLPFLGFVTILVHELGHVIGGKLVGMRFLFLIVGPLKISAPNGRLTFNWNSSLAMAGGLACCSPGNPSAFLKDLRWLIAGGPAFSLLLAVVALGLGWLPWGFVPEPVDRFLSMLFGTLSLFSLGIFLVTVVPGSAGNFKTDGRQFLELIRNDEKAARMNLLRMLVGQSMSGIRPRDWDATTIDMLDRLHNLPTAESSNSFGNIHGDRHATADRPSSRSSTDSTVDRTQKVLWASMLASRGQDVGDIDMLHRCLAYSMANADAYPAMARGSLYLEAAKFEADVRGDLDAAEWLIEAAPPGILVEAHGEPMARAAVARARGDLDSAQAFAREALEKVDLTIDRGCIPAVREYLQPMLRS